MSNNKTNNSITFEYPIRVIMLSRIKRNITAHKITQDIRIVFF